MIALPTVVKMENADTCQRFQRAMKNLAFSLTVASAAASRKDDCVLSQEMHHYTMDTIPLVLPAKYRMSTDEQAKCPVLHNC